MLTSLLTLALLSPTASAAFDGKIKNVRIRLRRSSRGYRQALVISDDHTAEDYSSQEAVVSVPIYDADDSADTAEPIAILMLETGEIKRVTERFTTTDIDFKESPMGIPYFLSVTLRDSSGAILASINDVEVTPTDKGAADADEGAEQDGGWLTDAGIIELEGGGEVSLSIGIRQKSNGDWKAVTRVKGDEELAAAGIAQVSLSFDEPFEGPVPSENPIGLDGRSVKVKTTTKPTQWEWELDGDGVADHVSSSLYYFWDLDGDGQFDDADEARISKYLSDDGSLDWCNADRFRLEMAVSDSKGNLQSQDAVYCHIDEKNGYGDILINSEPIDIE